MVICEYMSILQDMGEQVKGLVTVPQKVHYTIPLFRIGNTVDDLSTTRGEIAGFLRFASSGGLGSQAVSG